MLCRVVTKFDIVTAWGISICQRIINSSVRHYLLMIDGLLFLWMLIEIMLFICIMWRKSHVPEKKKRIMIPMIPFMIGILYAVGYIIHIPILYLVASDMTVVFLLIMIGFCEACIQCGLIPANEFYEELFKGSTLGAQITDDSYQVCYSSDAAKDFSVSVMKNAEKTPVDLGYEQLMNVKIHGGHMIWVNDISKMKALLEELEKTKQELSKKNEILKSEVILKEKKAQELELCFSESIENIRLCVFGISFQSTCEDYAAKEDMIAIYKAFEVIIEDMIDSFVALLINLNIREGQIYLKLNISCRRSVIEIVRQHLSCLNVISDIKTQDEDHYIMIKNRKEVKCNE